MDPLSLIGIGGGLISSISGLFTGGKQRRLAREAAKRSQEMFNQSLGFANKNLDLSKQGLSEAQLTANGRMAGAANMEQNINTNQANTIATAQRNATDAGQLLALAGAAQGQTNQAFGNLATAEAQNKVVQQGNVNQARAGVQQAQGELQNLYMHQSDQAAQAATGLGQAAQQNTFNALQGIGNMGMMAGMGMFGNFGGGNPLGPTQGRTTSVSGGGLGTSGAGWSAPAAAAPRFNFSLPQNSYSLFN